MDRQYYLSLHIQQGIEKQNVLNSIANITVQKLLMEIIIISPSINSLIFLKLKNNLKYIFVKSEIKIANFSH